MKLSLIVTHYDESWYTVRPFFDSVESQLGVDFEKDIEVIIVNDKEDGRLSHDLFEYFPFDVNIIDKGHHGVSGARNLGLEEAKGDYVMFCDCDDRFISAYAFHLYFKQMDKGFDIIKAPFIEDQVIDGDLKLIRHEHDISFVHGKAYRRQFLIDENIKFNESLTIHEDGYFNVIANILAQGKIHEMSPAVYLWKYNDNSVVRRDRDLFLYKSYGNLMDCRIAICRNLWERGLITEYFQAVSKTVVDSYYDFQKHDALKDENKELVESAEKEFARFYKEFRKDYHEINIKDIGTMMYACRTTAFINGLLVEQETLSQFLTRIVTSYIV